MTVSRQQKEKTAHIDAVLKVYRCLTKMSALILRDREAPATVRRDLLTLVTLTRRQVVEVEKTSSRISRRAAARTIILQPTAA